MREEKTTSISLSTTFWDNCTFDMVVYDNYWTGFQKTYGSILHSYTFIFVFKSYDIKHSYRFKKTKQKNNNNGMGFANSRDVIGWWTFDRTMSKRNCVGGQIFLGATRTKCLIAWQLLDGM
jgi:hypothetical protein